MAARGVLEARALRMVWLILCRTSCQDSRHGWSGGTSSAGGTGRPRVESSTRVGVRSTWPAKSAATTRDRTDRATPADACESQPGAPAV